MIDFENKRIMITGASSGIGRSLAIALGKRNASVVLCGRDTLRLQDTLNKMENHENHIIIPFDVTDFSIYTDVFEKATADGEKLDGMVHCAGIAPVIPIRAFSINNITQVMNTNFTSFMLLVSTYSRKKFSKGGSIVGVSSINAHYPSKAMGIYAASKMAIEGAVKTLAIELLEKGIRINCVVPGAVDTPMGNDELSEEFNKSVLRRQKMGVLTPVKISESIIYLLSEMSNGSTGRQLYVDGCYIGGD